MSSTHSIWAYLVSKQDYVGVVGDRHNATVHVCFPALLPIYWNVLTDSTDVLCTNNDKRVRLEVLFRYKMMVGHVRTRKALVTTFPFLVLEEKNIIFSPRNVQ